jgi:multidrug efflux pump subunit AcrB
VLATRDIGLAVLATTLSLLAVFLPVAFMSGIIGRFFKSFGLTMAFAIAVSLFVSFSLTPMLAARLLRPPEADGGVPKRTPLERAVDTFYLPVERLYVRTLRWVMGRRWARLGRYAAQAVERLRQVPGAVDVDSNLVVGNPEVRVSVDRERAANLGVDVADVANTLQLLVGGLKVSTFEDAGEDYDIQARADAAYRADLSGLSIMTVPSTSGRSVPLASLVTLKETVGPSQINRLSRQRQVTITANVAPGVGQSTVSDALKKIVDDLHIPPDYRAVPAGFTREQGRIVTAFVVAIAMTAIFMYLVLAAQFASWIHPVTIMLALPLTIPFAFVSLLLFHQELSIMSALSIIVLFGVVKKNAILQVDHTNHLRAEGRQRLDAILEANRDRLRPILMTTLAFVAGMLPLLFSRGIGAGLNRAIAGVVVGGQTLSLLLTLLATPVAYSFFDDVAMVWRRKRPTKVDRGEAELAELVMSHPQTPTPTAPATPTASAT